MGKKVEYKQDLKKDSTGQAYEDLVDVKVPSGYKRTFQHISVEDETSAYDLVRIGYLKTGGAHWWVEEENPGAGRLYWMRDAKVLRDGDVLLLRLWGTSSGDKLAAYVDGFTERVGGA